MKQDKYLIRHDMAQMAETGIIPRILIFPKYAKTSQPRLEVMPKQAALNRLIKEEGGGIKFAPPYLKRRHSLFLAHLMKQVRVFRLYYRDQDVNQVPELLDSVFRR